jgi:hypothetical protein
MLMDELDAVNRSFLESNRPGRIERPRTNYGSEGWGFESLRARCTLPLRKLANVASVVHLM